MSDVNFWSLKKGDKCFSIANLSTMSAEIIGQILQRLCRQGEAEREEFVGLEISDRSKSKESISNEIEQVGLLIADEDGLEKIADGQPFEVIKVIGVVKNDYGKLMKYVSEYFFHVVSVIRANRIDEDFEERALLASGIKDALRGWMRGFLDERSFFKPIDWGFSLEETEGTDALYRYVSFFLDKTTQQVSRGIKEVTKRFRSIREDENLKWEQLAEGSRSDSDKADAVMDYEREFSRKFDSLRKFVEEEGIPSVLLMGETGVGKSLIAKWIGREVDGKGIVRLSMASLGKDIAGSELFGSMKGAYTDARFRRGVFWSNRGRVVFLDKIGDMLPEHQVKLLTYMDKGYIRPTGYSHEGVFAPVFLIAATNRPVEEWVQSGSYKFRSDLFYRFNYRIKIPPLRDRKEDMKLLISICLQRVQRRRKVEKISFDAIDYLKEREYRGNFRELEEVIRTGVGRAILENSDILLLRHLVRG